MAVRYVVVSPVRDEEKFLENTIGSMVRQTSLPLQWILVNDGSTDRTAEIIDRWAARFPWIKHVERVQPGLTECATQGEDPNRPGHVPGKRGTRARLAKEIEAFYAGYDQITETDWQYVVKLDGDVSFDPNYFAGCFEHFERDARLGIGGGTICHLVNGELIAEVTPRFHVRGATKIYSRSCWESIGGVVCGAGWDTIDEAHAHMNGWVSRTFGELRVVHHRFTGSANGAWQNAVKNGVWSYLAGYHPLFMLLRCAKRLMKKPYVIGSLGLLYGFLSGYIQRIPRTADRQVREYLRAQQLRRMSLRTSMWR
jgi:biofilm PGA synthesis N-glycosyltransferase PgaC